MESPAYHFPYPYLLPCTVPMTAQCTPLKPPLVDLFCLDNIFYFSFSCINSQLVDFIDMPTFSVCIQYYVCLKAERDLHF